MNKIKNILILITGAIGAFFVGEIMGKIKNIALIIWGVLTALFYVHLTATSKGIVSMKKDK